MIFLTKLFRSIRKRKCWWFYAVSSGIFIASSYFICESQLGKVEISQDVRTYGRLLEEPIKFKEFGRVIAKIDEPCDLFGEFYYTEKENAPNQRFVFEEEVKQFDYLTSLGKELKEKYLDWGLGSLVVLGLIVVAILLWKLLKKMIYSLFYVSAKAIRDAKNGD